MRPTVPIDEWRIAVDLEATRAIQQQPGTPAYGCSCEQCLDWARDAAGLLPESLFDQLHRLGLVPERPTDVYSPHRTDDGEHLRVSFHVAGKLLSGPAAWLETETMGSQLRYRELMPWPAYLGLAVFNHRQTHYPAPVLPASSQSELIQIDMRMFIPRPGHSTRIDTRRHAR